jgi:hypothetical protein
MCPPRRSRGYGRRPLSQVTVLTAPSPERVIVPTAPMRCQRRPSTSASACPVGTLGTLRSPPHGGLRIAQGFPPAGEAEGTQRRARNGREGPGKLSLRLSRRRLLRPARFGSFDLPVPYDPS